jgi:3-oxoacyl-[acyl-carrier-protein] synthase II
MSNGRPRVVITGYGAVTPMGTTDDFWYSLVNGKSGIRRIKSFDPSHITVQIAGEITLDPRDYLDPKEARRMARASQMVQIATKLAIEHSGYLYEALEEETSRVGVAVGTAQGGFNVASRSNVRYEMDGRKPRPLELIHALPNIPGHFAGLEARATGPLMTITTACASSTQSIGEGAQLIRDGRSDVVFAGGVEALIEDYILEALHSMTVLASNYNDNPTRASRPFDNDREGFVYAEAASILVLESFEHAVERGAEIYGEILGYGASSDAFHVTTPDAEGRGARKAMQWALEDAHLNPEDVDYINAHGTSTPYNDRIETYAIKRLFGEHAYQIPISSTKSMVGHTLGASGGIEAVAIMKMLNENVIHPTINLETPDPECDLDYVPNEARQAEVTTALSNSFGFGGQNACIVFGKV